MADDASHDGRQYAFDRDVMLIAACVVLVLTTATAAFPVAAFTAMSVVAADARIADAASATEAAKRYLKARCTSQAPCKFKPEREGNQWRVWVELPKPASRKGPAQQIVLFFDTSGNLIRRLEVE